MSSVSLAHNQRMAESVEPHPTTRTAGRSVTSPPLPFRATFVNESCGSNRAPRRLGLRGTLCQQSGAAPCWGPGGGGGGGGSTCSYSPTGAPARTEYTAASLSKPLIHTPLASPHPSATPLHPSNRRPQPHPVKLAAPSSEWLCVTTDQRGSEDQPLRRSGP